MGKSLMTTVLKLPAITQKTILNVFKKVLWDIIIAIYGYLYDQHTTYAILLQVRLQSRDYQN